MKVWRRLAPIAVGVLLSAAWRHDIIVMVVACLVFLVAFVMQQES